MAGVPLAARLVGKNRGCPRLHPSAQSLGTDAFKASLKAKLDAF
jgi:hypothetical protein